MPNSDTAGRVWGDILSGFALLTRLPLPDHSPRGAGSAWGWPLVGAVVGGLVAVAAATAQAIGLPAGVTAALVLALLAALTGGLHEDGLADTADGLFGGWTRDRRLEIMKDSRIGSYGALALIFVMLAKWSALVAIVTAEGLAPALIAAGALSRAAMAVVMASLPPARDTGLSRSVGRPGGKTAAVAVGLALVIGGAAIGPALLAALALITLTTTALALIARARIGGQTGDILGATQQLADLAALTMIAAALP
ncbi:MAG: adenosylcobinamide-GDP ribazoletransferase [Pseudomonadota bacterium]